MTKTHPEIINIPLEEKGREYSFTFPEAVKEFTLKARFNNDIRLAYRPGESKKNFVRIPGKSSKTVSDIQFPSQEHGRTIYFSCDTAGETLEIEYWK